MIFIAVRAARRPEWGMSVVREASRDVGALALALTSPAPSADVVDAMGVGDLLPDLVRVEAEVEADADAARLLKKSSSAGSGTEAEADGRLLRRGVAGDRVDNGLRRVLFCPLDSWVHPRRRTRRGSGAISFGNDRDTRDTRTHGTHGSLQEVGVGCL